MLPYVVLAAEIGAFSLLTLYGSVLVSMHREAGCEPARPSNDRIGRALLLSARTAFRAGTLALVLASIFYGGLT